MTERPGSAQRSPVRALAWIPGALLLFPRLLYPMQMDQYFHHYLGWRLLHGGLPYLASFDQNFPGGAVLYAVGIALFGQTSLGFALYDLLVQSFTCYLIARLALRLDRTAVTAWLAPAIYAFVYIGLGVWDVGQRDSFIAPMLMLLLLVLMKEPITSRGWFFAGLLVGAMTLTRPLFAMSALIVLVIWVSRRADRRPLVLATLGALLLPLLTLLVYVAIGHAHELYEATIAFNLEVYSKFRHGVNLRGSGTMTIVMIIGIALYALRRPTWREWLPVAIALLIAPVSTWIQGQGDPHHTTPSYAVAALLAGLGFAWTIGWIRARTNPTLAVLAIALISVILLWRGLDRIPATLIAAWLRDTPLERLYEMQDRGDVKLEEEFGVASYIGSHTAPTDPIYIFSMRIWPYELADRLPPTRFQSPEHLVMQPADQPLTPIQQRWRTELMQSLAARPPKFILITTTDQMWLYPHAEASIDQVKRFPEFGAFLTNYAIDTTIGAYRVFRRAN